MPQVAVREVDREVFPPTWIPTVEALCQTVVREVTMSIFSSGFGGLFPWAEGCLGVCMDKELSLVPLEWQLEFCTMGLFRWLSTEHAHQSPEILSPGSVQDGSKSPIGKTPDTTWGCSVGVR